MYTYALNETKCDPMMDLAPFEPYNNNVCIIFIISRCLFSINRFESFNDVLETLQDDSASLPEIFLVVYQRNHLYLFDVAVKARYIIRCLCSVWSLSQASFSYSCFLNSRYLEH